MALREEIQRLKTYFWGKTEFPSQKQINLPLPPMASGGVTATTILTYTPAYVFHNSTADRMDWNIATPTGWAKSGGQRLFVDILYCHTSTGTGNTLWVAEHRRWLEGSTLPTSLSTSGTVLKASAGVAYQLLIATIEVGLITDVDGFQFKLYRNGSDGTDTAPDAYLLTVRVYKKASFNDFV